MVLLKLTNSTDEKSVVNKHCSDFETKFMQLPHNLIGNQLVDLIKNIFRREEALYLACNEERAFFRFRRS